MQNVARLPQTNKIETAKELVQQLYTAEAALDSAMLEANRLMQTMIEARQELALPATFGTEALARVAATVGEISQAQGELTTAHKELDALRKRMGMRAAMIGVHDKPEEGHDPRG